MNFVKFLDIFFCRTPPSNHFSYDVAFSFLQISEVCSLNQFIWWGNDKLGEGIHKPVQCGGHPCTDLGIVSERKEGTEKLIKVE